MAGGVLTKVDSVDLLDRLAGSDGGDLFGASDDTQEDVVVECDDAKSSLCGGDGMEMGQVKGGLFGELDHASRS